MRRIIIPILTALMFAACKTTPDSSGNSSHVKDLSTQTNEKSLQRVFLDRRNKVLEKIKDGIIIIRSDYGFAGGRNEFRPANNFYYLSGFTQPGSILVLDAKGSSGYTLFLSEKTIADAIYTGEVPSVADVMNTCMADTVLPLIQSDRVIEESIKNGIPVYIDNSDTRFRTFIQGMISSVNGDKSLLRNVGPLMEEMRVIKDTLEISQLSKAVKITGDGFINACRICLPGMYENEIEAMIEYTFRKEGSAMPAFQSIVGSGPNAVKLHYSENNRQMHDGDLLLMDIGSEYGNYCGDVTRTIPVGGKFSNEQRNIYELVLKSQKAAIDEMRPGKSFIEGHIASTRILVRGLFELGLITDTTSIWQKKFYILYPISHYMGMDVHDVGDYGTTFPELLENVASDTIYGRKLEKGMVLTIEPGLYFRSNGLTQLYELFGNEVTKNELNDFITKVTPVYEKYSNIGVRIEDDILIVENGCKNLSADIPREINQIEDLMKENNRLNVTF